MEHSRDYPWYATVEGDSLAQGDLLASFEVPVPLAATEAGQTIIESKLEVSDLVIMTQTCDMEHGKAKSVLLCPRWDLWEFCKAAQDRQENWGSKTRDDLRKGNLPGYHLLNEAAQDGLAIGLSVVDFHELYTAPTVVVKEFARGAGKRLRLLPPYREHLAQAFARFFMRVGLPVDIPAEKLKSPPIQPY